MYSNVLVCVDGSEPARRAANTGAEIAAKFDAELHIMTVTRPYKVSPRLKQFLQAENLMGEPKYVLDQMTKEIISDGRKHAEASGVRKIETHILEGKPARTIVEFARDEDIDLVVLGSRGVGEAEGSMLGSVSHKVSSLAHCTVVVVR
ncbi:MAG: universal stress protein [Alphaproteobacteria bacterium]|jgi:nucleotide-binding universal stress UspA family protein|nr:universal stress protein UspA [Rhodospirillaceae bacterium]MDP6406812.1 universal stress protein [Alphaproteobacteria bacterium]MDP6624099.1 universal stress protein [Alphaproteobacteria bacterium]|tara:strand:+ start:217 stop:660 length:444 start_codon:yes stop_codon:yes gene_type:complete